jgi:hypothetical protein
MRCRSDGRDALPRERRTSKEGANLGKVEASEIFEQAIKPEDFASSAGSPWKAPPQLHHESLGAFHCSESAVFILRNDFRREAVGCFLRREQRAYLKTLVESRTLRTSGPNCRHRCPDCVVIR